jgi:MFS family permease
MCSLAPANEQGATISVAQSAGSLARILGPLFAATLYLHVAPLPYATCGVISILAGVLAVRRLSKK